MFKKVIINERHFFSKYLVSITDRLHHRWD